MGTNFYLLDGTHIGKRSAAGFYCWNCGVTLNKNGKDAVHKGFSRSSPHGPDCEGEILCSCGWHKTCPKCGAKPVKENWTDGAAGRELGFNKSKPKKKTGVASCSSFSWALHPDKFNASKVKIIRDEYKRRYTRKQFLAVLEECPLQYTHSVGREFS